MGIPSDHHRYEEAAALAELLPADQRERFAAFVLDLSGNDTGIRRWAHDAGHLPRPTRGRST